LRHRSGGEARVARFETRAARAPQREDVRIRRAPLVLMSGPQDRLSNGRFETRGGAGFIRGTRAERVYREAKVFAIGGGAEEIMKDLAAKQLGWWG
jgi:alkylation response protein AidB-like acyl-CoA dehydrogenase